MVKIFILLALAIIVCALFLAAFALVKRPENKDPKATVKALTVRIGLSIALLITIVILVSTGVITPSVAQ